jgi:hypothetical protein
MEARSFHTAWTQSGHFFARRIVHHGGESEAGALHEVLAPKGWTQMRSRLLIRTSMAAFGISVVLAGCSSNSASIWSGEAKSPSGRWVATATTKQTGGPGTASVDTAVYLRWSASSWPPTLVLGLSNETAYPLGITAVRMSWVTEDHLDLGYCEGAVGFQAIKAGGNVDISTHQLDEADCPRRDAIK